MHERDLVLVDPICNLICIAVAATHGVFLRRLHMPCEKHQLVHWCSCIAFLRAASTSPSGLRDCTQLHFAHLLCGLPDLFFSASKTCSPNCDSRRCLKGDVLRWRFTTLSFQTLICDADVWPSLLTIRGASPPSSEEKSESEEYMASVSTVIS